jgi:predicted AlkP superfamily phosphohydrolase/phosphomutase/tetratricopeptide (TPR) repeat protein
MGILDHSPRPKVLLIGWDSADWKIIHPLVDRGEMPMLRRVIEGGVCGNLRTLDPMLSPMLWTSIATGKRAYDHGVLGFAEVEPLSGRVRPVTAASRRCRAVWDILAAQGLRCHVLGWFASHGGQIPGGGVISNLFTAPTAPPGAAWPPAPRGTIWPEDNADVLNALRVSPEDIDGATVGLFIPRWSEIDLAQDNRPNRLRVHLAEAFTIQAAACWTLEHTEWDFTAVYFRAIDELAHHFMPFHPPRIDGVPEREFELYREVMNGAYRLHDLMLARLIALAPPETHVVLVSDHGFHSDHLRPKFVPKIPAGITVWHREHGIFAGAGPQFARDQLIHGAGLLDVTPTLLHLFGLPIGADMEGKVLLEAFAEPRPPASVPTWEDAAVMPVASVMSEQESRALLEQFADLGYVDKPSGNPSEDAASTARENQWTLARALLDGGRPSLALPVLEDLCAASPARTDFGQTLARCQTRLGLLDAAAATIDAMLETFASVGPAAILRAQVALERGDAAGSLAWLEQARESTSSEPRFWRQLGYALIQLRRWADAQEAFERLASLSPDDAPAHLGLATCHLHRQRPEQAVEAALTAVSLEFTLARAHFVLARALVRLRDLRGAEQALRTALRLAPTLDQAHQLLATLCRVTSRWDEFLIHQAARIAILKGRDEQTGRVAQLRDESRQRAALRDRAPAPTLAAAPLEPLDITIVSGLPRSGTSLMMQLLEAGGHPLLTDGTRAADENNPRGYYECEAIRELPRNPSVLAAAADRAVKIVSALLPHLPRQHRYKVLFMRRPLEEIARSQHRMRFGAPGDAAEIAAKVVPLLDKHLTATLDLLHSSPQVSLLEVDYQALIRNPAPVLAQLVNFLGPVTLPHADLMAAVVDARLHRQRM